MERVGVRELRQNASAVLDKVEHGEVFTVTVQGRDVAVIRPIPKSPWVGEAAMRSIYSTPVDASWAEEIRKDRRAEDRPEDPWGQR